MDDVSRVPTARYQRAFGTPNIEKCFDAKIRCTGEEENKVYRILTVRFGH